MATRIPLKRRFGSQSPSRSARERAQRVADFAQARWESYIGGLADRYQDAYRKAMVVKVHAGAVVLELNYNKAGKDGSLAKAVERGYGSGGYGTSGPYDMRKTLLTSPTAQANVSKYGKRLLDVPMGMSAQDVVRLGGDEALKAASKLKATMRKGSWGDRFSNPSGFVDKLISQERTVNFGQGPVRVPGHATDPLANLYRFRKNRKAGQFGTFRRITEDGKPWVGKPIKAHRLIRKVARDVKRNLKGLS